MEKSFYTGSSQFVNSPSINGSKGKEAEMVSDMQFRRKDKKRIQTDIPEETSWAEWIKWKEDCRQSYSTFLILEQLIDPSYQKRNVI
jgi:hypothetical protein